MREGWARGFAGAALSLALLIPTPARATHGGMEYAEPLGWDAADHRAYFLIHSVSESDLGPFVVFIDVDGPEPYRPVQVTWSKSTNDRNAHFASRLAALRRRLRPFVDLPGRRFFITRGRFGKTAWPP